MLSLPGLSPLKRCYVVQTRPSNTLLGVVLGLLMMFAGATTLATDEVRRHPSSRQPVELSHSFLSVGNTYGPQETATQALPDCFSSPKANPSRGVWQRAERGIEESPILQHTRCSPYDRCDRKWRNEHHAQDGPRPYWTWQPRECVLEALTEQNFCRAMEGRKGLLLVGDSLTMEMAMTLGAVLQAEMVQTDLEAEEDHAGGPMQMDFTACGGALHFSFRRNDYLDTRDDPFPSTKCVDDDFGALCIVFASDAVLSQFDTLVVNSGAHPRHGGAGEYGKAMRDASQKVTASMERLHGDKATLIVRNTVPGHPHCGERVFGSPLDEGYALNSINGGPTEYHWAELLGYNQVLQTAFRESDMHVHGGWKLLDAYSPVMMRADSHMGPRIDGKGKDDCLHYCIPGPIDHWVVLLQNILVADTRGR